MKGYVYKYTFSNGKIYVGQTRRDVNVRHREHMNPSTGPLNPRFWQAYQELGEPKLEIIKEIEDENNYELIQALNRCETNREGYTNLICDFEMKIKKPPPKRRHRN